jgi:hypothetical protein
MDQQKIKDVISATGCDEKLAHIILEFTDGVVENACKIIFAIPKDILVVVARFQAARVQKQGMLVLAYAYKKRKVERLEALVASQKEIVESVQENSLQPLFKLMEENRQKITEQDQNDTKDLLALLRKEESIVKLRELIDEEGKFEEQSLSSWLNDILFRTFADSNLTIRISTRMVDSFQLNRGEKEIVSDAKEVQEPAAAEKKTAENEGSRPEYKNDSVILLMSQPVISPVKGTPIPRFKIGDAVFAEISDPREVGAYLKKLLQEAATKEHPEYEGRVPALIEEMEYSTNTDNVSLIVKYGPGIYGRLLVPRDLKIEAPGKAQDSGEETKTGSAAWLLWVAVSAFIFLIILMAIIKK